MDEGVALLPARESTHKSYGRRWRRP